MDEKSFITLGPGANPVKSFTIVIYVFCNKLEWLSLASLSSLISCFVGKARSLP